MPFYLYALVGNPPDRLPPGVTGEALRSVRCSRMCAVVGEMAAPPQMTARSLIAQDAIVRQIAGRVDAILPVRFGTFAPDLGSFVEAVRVRAEELDAALVLVRGREQMTARLFRRREHDQEAQAFKVRSGVRAEQKTRAVDGPAGAGPGTRHLLERLARAGAAAPGVDELESEAASVVRATRVVRHDSDDLVASVYHLIDRGSVATYRKAIGAGPRAVRVVISGPHPPYAFGEGALA